MLALSGDTYRSHPGEPASETYYKDGGPLNLDKGAERRLHNLASDFEDRAPPSTLEDINMVWGWAWEVAHRRRMLLQGNRYARLSFPTDKQESLSLEYLYVGCLPLQLVKGWGVVRRQLPLRNVGTTGMRETNSWR